MAGIVIRDAKLRNASITMVAGEVLAAAEDKGLSNEAFRLYAVLAKEVNEREKLGRIPNQISTDTDYTDELIERGLLALEMHPTGYVAVLVWPTA